MNTMHKRMLIALVAFGLGSGSVVAHAGKGGCSQDDHGLAARGQRMHSPERMKERFEKRQTDLHDKLKLNANQESAWKAYQDVLRPGNPPARPARAEMEKLPAPERMEKMLGFMQEREKRMALRIAATREFYAVLTPEQQKIFDAEAFSGPRHRHAKH